VVAARQLSYADITALVTDLKRRAAGDGHVANAAFGLLMGMAKAAAPEGEDDISEVDIEAMTPEQRAAYRAILERALEEAEAAKNSQLGAD
jgi:hypothetical protein